jgi:type III restriction enzyme
MLDDVNRAKIVITNYHAFKLREHIELSKGGRQLLQRRGGEELNTLETEGQMDPACDARFDGDEDIFAINDEATRARSSARSKRSRPRFGSSRSRRIEERKAHSRPSRLGQQGCQSRADALALKLATGAGKTTVMAMLIRVAINAVRRPASKHFTRGFLS